MKFKIFSVHITLNSYLLLIYYWLYSWRPHVQIHFGCLTFKAKLALSKSPLTHFTLGISFTTFLVYFLFKVGQNGFYSINLSLKCGPNNFSVTRASPFHMLWGATPRVDCTKDDMHTAGHLFYRVTKPQLVSRREESGKCKSCVGRWQASNVSRSYGSCSGVGWRRWRSWLRCVRHPSALVNNPRTLTRTSVNPPPPPHHFIPDLWPFHKTNRVSSLSSKRERLSSFKNFVKSFFVPVLNYFSNKTQLFFAIVKMYLVSYVRKICLYLR